MPRDASKALPLALPFDVWASIEVRPAPTMTPADPASPLGKVLRNHRKALCYALNRGARPNVVHRGTYSLQMTAHVLTTSDRNLKQSATPSGD